MNRKDFIAQVGFGAVALLATQCGLSSCSKQNTTAVDFTLDISTGSLATNGGSLNHNGVIVARTSTGDFIAVSAACTHEGTSVNYSSSANNFVCPNHGATFNASGKATKGPASSALTQYQTALSGNTLRVFS